MKKIVFLFLLLNVAAFAQEPSKGLSYRERLLIRNSEVAEQNIAAINQIKLICANKALKTSSVIVQFDEIQKYAAALEYALKNQLPPIQSYEKIKSIAGDIQIAENLTKYSSAVLQEASKLTSKPGKTPEALMVRLQDYEGRLKETVKNEETFLKTVEESKKTGKFIYDASLYERSDLLRSYLNSGKDLKAALASADKPKKYKSLQTAMDKLLPFNSAADIEFVLKNIDQNFAAQKTLATNLKLADRSLNQIIEGNSNDDAWRKFGNNISKDFSEKNFDRYKSFFQKKEIYKEQFAEFAALSGDEPQKALSNDDFDVLYKVMLHERKAEFDSVLSVWTKRNINFKSAICAKAFAEKDAESWDEEDPAYVSANLYDVYLLYKIKDSYLVLVYDNVRFVDAARKSFALQMPVLKEYKVRK